VSLGHSAALQIKAAHAEFYQLEPGAIWEVRFIKGGQVFERKIIASYRGKAVRVIVPKEAMERYGFSIGETREIPFGQWHKLADAEREKSPTRTAKSRGTDGGNRA
jgi:hypothetical protein